MRPSWRTLIVAAGALLGCDPVHSRSVDALGPEAAGVNEGPEHRPGQPCLVCHGSTGPGSPKFGTAGTVFRSVADPVAAPGITVHLVDARGRSLDLVSNAAGNFYSEWDPTYPVHVDLRASGQEPVVMRTPIGRDGSCNGCHAEPVSRATAGRVYLETPAVEDGGP